MHTGSWNGTVQVNSILLLASLSATLFSGVTGRFSCACDATSDAKVLGLREQLQSWRECSNTGTPNSLKKDRNKDQSLSNVYQKR